MRHVASVAVPETRPTPPTPPAPAPAPTPDLLRARISDLKLTLAGSPVEKYVQQLHRELARKRLRHFKPDCYLTDEWGCPDLEPVIGIPFYLADARLMKIERERHDLESPREIMMYLRHEAGHALNYAYRLYRTEAWRELFGPFHRRYREHYRPVPFSRKYVRHIAGWYAQKHPDEDFAETFAVWLTPRSNWRRKYKSWPALAKLQYVDRVARLIRDRPPIHRARTDADITVDDMRVTVEHFYRRLERQNGATVNVTLEADLSDMFLPRGRRGKHVGCAADMIAKHRIELTDKVTYWTGVRRAVVRALVESMVDATRRLELHVDQRRESQALVELTAYATTLAMNKLTRGRFEQN